MSTIKLSACKIRNLEASKSRAKEIAHAVKVMPLAVSALRMIAEIAKNALAELESPTETKP